VDLGTTPKSYRQKVAVQNGDGVLTAKTTWKDSRVKIIADATRTYIVSSVGLVNRFTEWGTLGSGASGELGYDGLDYTFGTFTTIQGNFKLYGCKLSNFQAVANNSRIFLHPNIAGTYTEIYDTEVLSGGGTLSCGFNGFQVNKMRRVRFESLGVGVNGRMIGFDCPDSDTIRFHFPAGQYKIDTGGYVRIGNPVFVGAGSAALPADHHCRSRACS
jgi:hypothetical protein